MGTPGYPGNPVLMIALRPLKRWSQAGPCPPVPLNGIFWATAYQAPLLAQGGLASYAPPNTPEPPAEPPLTVNMVPGLAAGVSNASR
jgi:hypothetical protein